MFPAYCVLFALTVFFAATGRFLWMSFAYLLTGLFWYFHSMKKDFLDRPMNTNLILYLLTWPMMVLFAIPHYFEKRTNLERFEIAGPIHNPPKRDDFFTIAAFPTWRESLIFAQNRAHEHGGSVIITDTGKSSQPRYEVLPSGQIRQL